MLQNAYLVAKIGADTAENEQQFAEILTIGRRARRAMPLRRPRRAFFGAAFGVGLGVGLGAGLGAGLLPNLGCSCGQITTRQGGGSFFGLTVCLSVFLLILQNYLLVILLVITSILSSKISEFSGNTLTSARYLGFPKIPAKFGDNLNENYAI